MKKVKATLLNWRWWVVLPWIALIALPVAIVFKGIGALAFLLNFCSEFLVALTDKGEATLSKMIKASSKWTFHFHWTKSP